MMAGWRYHRPDHHQDIVPDRVAVVELQTKIHTKILNHREGLY